MEPEFKLSPEQKEALDQLVQVAEKLIDAIREVVRAFMDAVRKAFEGLMRFFTHLQLLEWRVPSRLAKSISEKIPASLAFQIGLHWFNGKAQSLE